MTKPNGGRTWEIDVPWTLGDNAPAINGAISDLATGPGGGTVYLEPAVYSIGSPILRRSNIFIKGAFRGPAIWDSVAATGTIIRWAGPAGGNIFSDKPFDSESRIDNGGISDLSIDGFGIAGNGISCLSSSRAHYKDLHIVGVTANGVYCGTMKTSAPLPNYRTSLESVTVSVGGGANGITLDGIRGSSLNTCFVVATDTHVTIKDGCAYALCNADDCYFFGAGSSRQAGGKGAAIYFGNSPDGGISGAFSNQFYGFWGDGMIVAGDGSRGNIVYTSSMDKYPEMYAGAGAVLTVVAVAGEVGLNGFVRNPLPAG